MEEQEELEALEGLVPQRMLPEPKLAVQFEGSWLATILDRHVSYASKFGTREYTYRYSPSAQSRQSGPQ